MSRVSVNAIPAFPMVFLVQILLIGNIRAQFPTPNTSYKDNSSPVGGNYNVGIGIGVLNPNPGPSADSNNVAVGYQTMKNNVSGS